jgi:hypothetical protein
MSEICSDTSDKNASGMSEKCSFISDKGLA